MTDEKLIELWKQFADTPVNDDDTIDEPFLHFEKGTNKFDVWQWFDENYSTGLLSLIRLLHE